MDAYLIVGNPNTRKSSLARALTGGFNRSRRDIALAGGRGTLRLYARAGSLQDARSSPDDFVGEVARQRCDALLCCLLPAAHPHAPDQLPAAAAYVARFERAGWRIAAIAVLGQDRGGLRSPRLQQFPQAGTAPINVTAAAVRAHFGWM
jgi:hypothetical protein